MRIVFSRDIGLVLPLSDEAALRSGHYRWANQWGPTIALQTARLVARVGRWRRTPPPKAMP